MPYRGFEVVFKVPEEVVDDIIDFIESSEPINAKEINKGEKE